MKHLKLLFSLGCLLTFTQCAEKKAETLSEGSTLSDLYNRALDTLMEGKEFRKAAKEFEEVERQHPFSPWALKAQLMAAYAYYEGDKYEEAIVNLQAFLDLNPTHKFAAYAQYLLAMCYYVQLSGVNRDQTMTHQALHAFKSLIKLYPDSVYAKDAAYKIDLCKEHLAGHDMEVGRFYQLSALPVAALDRFSDVVENYQTTTHTPEALHRMVESMLKMGMKKQAVITASVLGYNYPGSKWYEYTYALLKEQGLLEPDANKTGIVAKPALS